jgi:hypothetical protein
MFLASLLLAAAGCQARGENGPQSVSSINGGAFATAEPSAATPNRATATGPSQHTGTRHFIEFRSRYALTYGHSFVIFGRLNEAGQMIDPEVAGLAPKSDDPAVYMLGHVTPVPASTGWTDGDLEDEYMSASWRVMLSEPEYKKVVADIRKLQASSPLWHASLYNCNAFVGDIARSMGYKPPFHWLKPQQYITKLREMNGGPNAIGYTAPVVPATRASANMGAR